MFKKILFTVALICVSAFGMAQVNIGAPDTIDIDYSNPKEYEIKSVEVTGIQYLDKNALKTLADLTPGDRIKIPGERITKAIENLWKQGLLSDIKIVIKEVQGNFISLELQLQERPQLSGFTFTGVSKGEADKLREKITLARGQIITDNLLKTVSYKIKDYFIGKGYLNTDVKFDVKNDTTSKNKQTLTINVLKNSKTKIHEIKWVGNKVFSASKLNGRLKETKEKHWYHFFKTSKYIEENFVEDKEKVIAKYLEKGYRDAKITFDTVYKHDKNTVNLEIHISEGHPYYFRI